MTTCRCQNFLQDTCRTRYFPEKSAPISASRLGVEGALLPARPESEAAVRPGGSGRFTRLSVAEPARFWPPAALMDPHPGAQCEQSAVAQGRLFPRRPTGVPLCR
jgi:hypothetical protein